MSNDNPTADDGAMGNERVNSPLEENLKSGSTWTRFLFMVISVVLISLASMVGTVVVVLGFFWVLFTGEVNQQLRDVGQSLASYVYEITRYLTFNSDDRPFPLGGEWPSSSTSEH